MGIADDPMWSPTNTRAVPRLDSNENLIPTMRMLGNDLVNSPSHYTRGGIETIAFIEAKQLNYNRGNAIKYITRAGWKYDPAKATEDGPPTETIQDLEKAVWYLQREIKTLKGK